MRAANSGGQLSSTGLQISVARRVLDSLRASFGDQISEAAPVLLCSSHGQVLFTAAARTISPKGDCYLAE